MPIWAALEQQAERELAAVGDATLGEWRERGNHVFHLRRRLSAAEQKRTGPVRDIRQTAEAARRAMRIGRMLDYAPPEVLADELGPYRHQRPKV